MPLVDMPIEQLLAYQGSSPCPADIDAYWDGQLANMRAVDPQPELVPAPFTSPVADCFDLYFTGTKGARIHAKLLKPKKIERPAPALLLFHGYSGHSGGWLDKLSYVGAGFVVAALDCRGQAGYSEDVGGVKGTTYQGQIIRGLDGPKEDMTMAQIFLDTAQLARVVMDMEEVDETRVGAHGGSQGGGLTLACASLEPRIKAAYPLFPFLCDYRRVWEMDLDINAYAELRTYFRSYDPKHLREAEIFEKLGYIDVQNLTKRIRAKVLMVTGLLDTTCPPSTQFAAYNKISSEKSYILYPDFGHEGPPLALDDAYVFFCENLLG